MAAVAAGCGGDQEEPEPSDPSPATTEPALTAPPTTTPEEQAEAEIIAIFEDLIAAWDEFKSSASDYGGGSGIAWNVELVETWPLKAQASVELTNWVAVWRQTEIEQRGNSVIVGHEVATIQFDAAGSGLHEAASTACLDLSALRYVTFDEDVAELDYVPDRSQTWTMDWAFGPDKADWRLEAIDITRNEQC
ncbi:hypothetical protein [Jiangella asiatica]|uniref:hypothetical protein n=1 Tax=Jiangella asiatica TaxID=2530372 RepID=UPI0013A5F2B4|nr:hypothetical protein [Jiangella asiatica]